MVNSKQAKKILKIHQKTSISFLGWHHQYLYQCAPLPSGPKMGKPTPPPEEILGKPTPLRLLTESVKEIFGKATPLSLKKSRDI